MIFFKLKFKSKFITCFFNLLTQDRQSYGEFLSASNSDNTLKEFDVISNTTVGTQLMTTRIIAILVDSKTFSKD
jgi:hypothetical protein